MQTNPSILRFSVIPKTPADQEKLDATLAKLRCDDQDLHVLRDSESGSATLLATGHEHLDSVFDHIWNVHRDGVIFSKPEVIYVKTVSAVAEGEGWYVRQVGGSGNHGHCWLRVEPNERGAGCTFINGIEHGQISERFIGLIEHSVRLAMGRGGWDNNEMVDIKVTLFDGSSEVHSNGMAFQIAASAAFRNAVRKARSMLLEPVMEVVVTVPEKYMGEVIRDLNARRGRIERINALDETQSIHAVVPLATMFGYAPMLRASTHGYGSYKTQFKQYEACSADPGPDESGPGVRVDRPSGGRGPTLVAQNRADSE